MQRAEGNSLPNQNGECAGKDLSRRIHEVSEDAAEPGLHQGFPPPAYRSLSTASCLPSALYSTAC